MVSRFIKMVVTQLSIKPMMIKSAFLAAALGAVTALAACDQSNAKTSCYGAAALANHCSLAGKSYRPSIASAAQVAKGPERNQELCRSRLVKSSGLTKVCYLGVAPARAQKQVAIFGDSHSAAWRPAFNVIAKRQRWSVVSAMASVCDYTTQNHIRVPGPKARDCRRFRAAVPRFLTSHPKIETVFFTGVSRGVKRGEVRDYQKAWTQLPATVKEVVVIADNPRTLSGLSDCLAEAKRTGRAPGLACSRPRSRAVVADSAVVAAREAGGRYRAIDMSNYFCSSERCYPVIGSLLVYGDGNHQTRQFNQTLAPYFWQAYQGL